MTSSQGHVHPPGSVLGRLVKGLVFIITFTLAYISSPYMIYREFFKRPKKFEELPNRSGEVCVLTGGTRGIGLKVLEKLLKARFHVVIGCRSLVAGQEVVDSLRASGLESGSTKIFQLDLKSLKSVRKFAENVLNAVPRIDLLINNAGIMLAPYELTEDGYESQFQVNYLSHFLITQALLPKIKETSLRSDKRQNCRIVNVSSDANYAGRLDFEELETVSVFDSGSAYCNSKLCQASHAAYLDKRLRSEGLAVNVYACHPGIIYSELWQNAGKLLYKGLGWVKFIFRTTQDGADNVIYTALSPELEGTGGVYINSNEIATPNRQVGNLELQRRLWERSLQLIDN